MENIIFKITSPLMDKLNKYFLLINKTLEIFVGTVYLEQIHDGFLYICKDMATFKLLHLPIPSEIRTYVKSLEINNTSQLSVDDIIQKQNFPDSGLVLRFNAQNEKSKKSISELLRYYNTLIPDISADQKSEAEIEILYRNYDAFKFQINLIYVSQELQAKLKPEMEK
jgi:hypothetical protein